ncbi:hypothetical protein RRG08_031280 [Elysia crispata]|uniref:Uncharacterized protein n=1 Tax=Elysia crispata TaxID=231223 RepID=A0AAE1DZF0_9GAST|nr:hypothetical protein RRG08_031280 [Elysia crispata]
MGSEFPEVSMELSGSRRANLCSHPLVIVIREIFGDYYCDKHQHALLHRQLLLGNRRAPLQFDRISRRSSQRFVRSSSALWCELHQVSNLTSQPYTADFGTALTLASRKSKTLWDNIGEYKNEPNKQEEKKLTTAQPRRVTSYDIRGGGKPLIKIVQDYATAAVCCHLHWSAAVSGGVVHTPGPDTRTEGAA